MTRNEPPPSVGSTGTFQERLSRVLATPEIRDDNRLVDPDNRLAALLFEEGEITPDRAGDHPAGTDLPAASRSRPGTTPVTTRRP